MNIRSYEPYDVMELKRIHEKHFKHEFEFPDFLKGYLCAVTIEDEKGIITTGGVRHIAEAVALTNKDRSVRDRHGALLKLCQVLAYMASAHGHNQLHAFVQEPTWTKQLIKAGFHITVGQGLVLELNNGKR